MGVAEMRVELDKKGLFALASDTRLEILHALEPMRSTVTQLAEKVGVDKAAVYRHLQKLVDGGLVRRYDDHGFVYYGLSWKARDLLNPTDNTKIIILLTCSVLLTAVAIGALIIGLTATWGGPSGIDFPLGDFRFGESQTTGGDSLNGSPPGVVWPIPAALLSAAAVLFLMSTRLLWRPKEKKSP